MLNRSPCSTARRSISGKKNEDVLNWLEQANLITPDDVPALKRTRYATRAGLRDVVRTLLDQRKAGGKVDVAG